jgi:gluconolactonase
MKRFLPLLVALSLGAMAYGCKDDKDNKSNSGNKNPGQQPGTPGSSGSSGAPTTEEMNTNPIEGIEAPTVLQKVDAYTDGPVWHAGMGVLFFSTPLGDGALWRMMPDGRQLKVRDGVQAQGTQPIGNTINAAGELITAEAKRLVRQPAESDGGALTVIAERYSGTPAPAGDGGAPAATEGAFDTLNDVVARKDGTLYVTDPGYFAAVGTVVANRIYRIDPQAAQGSNVQVVEAFEDVPKPNGIALSPDEKTLYVGFTAPAVGTLPFIRKYIVNDDGTLGEWTKFVDIGPEGSEPDGLAVDKVGNVYVASKAGVEVYKPDGKQWGIVQIPEKPTGLTFGGEDMKTLYITTDNTSIWQLKMKLAGISQ